MIRSRPLRAFLGYPRGRQPGHYAGAAAGRARRREPVWACHDHRRAQCRAGSRHYCSRRGVQLSPEVVPARQSEGKRAPSSGSSTAALSYRSDHRRTRCPPAAAIMPNFVGGSAHSGSIASVPAEGPVWAQVARSGAGLAPRSAWPLGHSRGIQHRWATDRPLGTRARDSGLPGGPCGPDRMYPAASPSGFRAGPGRCCRHWNTRTVAVISCHGPGPA